MLIQVEMIEAEVCEAERRDAGSALRSVTLRIRSAQFWAPCLAGPERIRHIPVLRLPFTSRANPRVLVAKNDSFSLFWSARSFLSSCAIFFFKYENCLSGHPSRDPGDGALNIATRATLWPCNRSSR